MRSRERIRGDGFFLMMLPELTLNMVWFLLPVAAASGWLAARRLYNNNASVGRPLMAPEYFKGLSYLLNEQQDKAIEVFTRLLDLESDTAEIHLALGNLFRRRGEVSRAIQIHQNLAAWPSLDDEQRSAALFELALDYLRSGLLDRAESIFHELTHAGSYRGRALGKLVDIYQQEKDWDKAIAYALESHTVSDVDMSTRIAQFYCERAENEAVAGDIRTAIQSTKDALAADPNCVRASMLEAELRKRSGRLAKAIKAYKRVEQQDPDFVHEVIYPLQECYRELDRLDAFVDYLERLSQRRRGVTPVLVLAELLAQRSGRRQAIDYLNNTLRDTPSLRGLSRMIHYALEEADDGARDDLMLLKAFTDRLLDGRALYKCRHCGFSGRSLHWQCPGCRYWATMRRIRGIGGE
ncbi:MAG: lipopolysaccharide assembly protein LapB [Gammaproteobacteria bacterium]